MGAQNILSTHNIMQRLRDAFTRPRPTFVGFVTAGFPTREHTVPVMLALQRAGAGVIELGVPFSDPLADGKAIQHSSNVALANGINVPAILELVREARKQGVTIPVVLMGYFNPILSYGLERIAKDAKDAGVDGFIIVDLPPEEAGEILQHLHANDLSFIPLVTPTTPSSRLPLIAKVATSFVYCVSVAGVTGQRTSVSTALPALLQRIREHVDVPVAVGFGVSERSHVVEIAKQGAQGVVVGSAIITAIDGCSTPEESASKVEALVRGLLQGDENFEAVKSDAKSQTQPVTGVMGSDEFRSAGKFGEFGGCYVPETLVFAHEQLWEQFQATKDDPEFVREIDRLRREYVGGPTPLYHARRLSEYAGGAEIWLKREDLAHTGAHKINNALGQALLVKRMGKRRVIAETGAGQHGVATATACALLGLECMVYMGAEDIRRQALNVFRMKLLGATVVPVTSGSQTLKDAINEAMRDWVTNVETTHYIVGSAIGPHPFPTIVRHFQSVIGSEAREEFLRRTNALPDVVLACVGGGSNAIGMFAPFLLDDSVRIVGVEAGGASGISGLHSATLSAGRPGVLHGTRTYLQQTVDGQIDETHSVSAGLDYPGVGPQHAYLKDAGRAEYVPVTDGEAMDALQRLSQLEGIIPALESAHAVHHAMTVAKQLDKSKRVLVCLSGRGDKDMVTVARILGHELGV
eukprot:c9069_g1_i2.p1 GENE.c9069_g1_i2~~c9069_g1_i2.p1  ORF type:complete len:694 (+),score=171.89 c9069_g1_i2:3-2084(+)